MSTIMTSYIASRLRFHNENELQAAAMYAVIMNSLRVHNDNFIKTNSLRTRLRVHNEQNFLPAG